MLYAYEKSRGRRVNEQLELLPCRTRCGYCDRELDLQPGGHYQCSTCAPRLALIRTMDEWEAFIAESRVA